MRGPRRQEKVQAREEVQEREQVGQVPQTVREGCLQEVQQENGHVQEKGQEPLLEDLLRTLQRRRPDLQSLLRSRTHNLLTRLWTIPSCLHRLRRGQACLPRSVPS